MGIDMKSVIGLGTDGASAMTGKKNGVSAFLKKENPHCINVHCIAHRLALCSSQAANPGGGGGVLPMWWVIHMCRGFDPLFSLWQDRARSFWGTFSHPPTAKLSFGVQKLPIFTKIDLFGPKFNFFLDLFGSNFQRPAAPPHQFSGRVTPPPPPPPPPPGSQSGTISKILSGNCYFTFLLL